jgi:hypothetical protein
LGVAPPHTKLGPTALHAVPQSTLWPQLSTTVPHLPLQVVLCAAGTQQVLGAAFPAPHSDGVVQLTPPFCAEQVTVCPQLLATGPHLPLQVTVSAWGVQPHTLTTPPPPQVWPGPAAAHVSPQSTLAPQLLLTVPHLPAQVVAVTSGVQALHAPPAQP